MAWRLSLLYTPAKAKLKPLGNTMWTLPGNEYRLHESSPAATHGARNLITVRVYHGKKAAAQVLDGPQTSSFSRTLEPEMHPHLRSAPYPNFGSRVSVWLSRLILCSSGET